MIENLAQENLDSELEQQLQAYEKSQYVPEPASTSKTIKPAEEAENAEDSADADEAEGGEATEDEGDGEATSGKIRSKRLPYTVVEVANLIDRNIRGWKRDVQQKAGCCSG